MRRALLAAIVAMSGLTVVNAEASGSCAGVRSFGHGWSLIQPPAAPGFDGVAGQGTIGARLVDLATVAGQPETLLTSDGDLIFRSADGGCSWQSVYDVTTDLPASWETAPYVVARFAAADPGPHGGDRVYAFLQPGFNIQFALTFAAAPPTLVLMSDDGGKTWQLQQPPVDAALVTGPRCLSLIDVSVSPVNQNEMFMLCAAALVDSLVDTEVHHNLAEAWHSTDGGQTWTRFDFPVTFGANVVAADPYQAGVAWTVGESQPKGSEDEHLTVYRTSDGGATWSSRRMAHAGVGIGWQVTVAPGRGGRTHALIASLPVSMYESTDGTGKHWSAHAVDQGVKPMLLTNQFGPDRRDLLSTDTDNTAGGCQATYVLHRVNRRGRSVFVTLPTQLGYFWDWRYTGGSHPSIVGFTGAHSGGAVGCTSGQLPSLLRYQPA